MPPVAGVTHDLVLRYGPPSAFQYQGLMLPNAQAKSSEPYNPFAPQTRQGNATNQDFSITSVWEMFNDLSSGTGKLKPSKVESNGFAFAQGNGVGVNIGPTPYTGYKGRVYPAANVVATQEVAVNGPNLPTVVDSDDGGFWVDANKALLSDNQWARCAVTNKYLQLSGFGFGVTSAVVGIKVDIEAKSDSPEWVFIACQIGKDGVFTNPTAQTGHFGVSTDKATYTYGATNDLWGTTFTPAEVNAATFQVRIYSPQNWGSNLQIDSVKVTVYSVATGGTLYVNAPQMLTFKGSLYSFHDKKIYRLENTTWLEVGNTTDPIKQLYTDGDTLWATQGTGNFTRKSTDGAVWADDTFKADFMTNGENGVIAYTAGATLNPGGTHPSKLIGATTTACKGLLWLDTGLWIAKPEGLFLWTSADDKVACKFAAAEMTDLMNFNVFTIHNRLLYFNIRNKLYFITNDRYTEIFPDETNGFDYFSCACATSGPILFGVGMQGRQYLMMFRGPSEPGLIPLWSDDDGTSPVRSIGVIPNVAPYYLQVHFQVGAIGLKCLNMTSRYDPYDYLPLVEATAPFIDLTPHDGGFKVIPKWFYSVAINVTDPCDTTFCRVDYSVDGGETYHTLVDEDGAAKIFTLDEEVVGAYFPLDTVGYTVRLRLYLWSTDASTAAAIDTITVRGDVMTRKRDIISFTVTATETVVGRKMGVRDTGEAIRTALFAAAAQGYPSAIQDSTGTWHLALFRPPTPRVAYVSEVDSATKKISYNQVIQVALVEIDTLDNSGNFKAWQAG